MFHAAILLWAAAAAHLVSGNVDFGLAANTPDRLCAGGLARQPLVRPRAARPCCAATLAVVLIGAGMALLAKAGLGIPSAALVPFPSRSWPCWS